MVTPVSDFMSKKVLTEWVKDRQIHTASFVPKKTLTFKVFLYNFLYSGNPFAFDFSNRRGVLEGSWKDSHSSYRYGTVRFTFKLYRYSTVHIQAIGTVRFTFKLYRYSTVHIQAIGTVRFTFKLYGYSTVHIQAI